MRIVIKIGTSTLAYPTGHLHIRRVEELCKVVSDLKNSGQEIILVSSGAVGMGMGKLQLKSRPTELSLKQAAAAVGQCELMYTYDRLFGMFNHTVAQVLLTAGNLTDEKQHENFTNTIGQLLALNVIPIINENDTVATKELIFGDNDTLAAVVARSVSADLLILLSDIDGLFTADPRKDPDAKLIPVVQQITPDIEALAGGSVSGVGTGGMTTKIEAAKIANDSGCDMVIANGVDPSILYGILDGESIGTRFVGRKNR